MRWPSSPFVGPDFPTPTSYTCAIQCAHRYFQTMTVFCLTLIDRPIIITHCHRKQGSGGIKLSMMLGLRQAYCHPPSFRVSAPSESHHHQQPTHETDLTPGRLLSFLRGSSRLRISDGMDSFDRWGKLPPTFIGCSSQGVLPSACR